MLYCVKLRQYLQSLCSIFFLVWFFGLPILLPLFFLKVVKGISLKIILVCFVFLTCYLFLKTFGLGRKKTKQENFTDFSLFVLLYYIFSWSNFSLADIVRLATQTCFRCRTASLNHVSQKKLVEKIWSFFFMEGEYVDAVLWRATWNISYGKNVLFFCILSRESIFNDLKP